MKYVGTVQGNKEMAVPVYVGKDTVYVHTDITRVATDDDSEVYQYEETQYDLNEYIQLMVERQVKQDATIDYIAMMADIELPESEA